MAKSLQALCLVSVILCLLIVFTQCKKCVKHDSCTCVFDDGSGMIDLTPLRKTDGFPLFLDLPAAIGGYSYSYNPCGAFTEVTCVNVAACQYDPINFLFWDIGHPDKVSFDYNGLSVVANYEAGDGVRKSSVTLLCDPGATKTTLDVLGETEATHYEFTLKSASACIVPADKPVPGGSGGLSAGSVMLIIFFCLLVVYFVAGVVFNKVQRKETGMGLVPNRGFWFALPGLVKEGFLFVKNKIQNKRSTYSEVK